MEAGSTFLLTQADKHLWVILSEPKKNSEVVLLVSVTTLRTHKDQSCVITRGEHPFITHDSCVFYEDARDASLTQLYALKDAGLLCMRESFSDGLLARVREGARITGELKLKYLQLLEDQNLIEPTPF